MNYNFTTDKPIYQQLMESFIISIVSNELPVGSKIDSVRDLALKARVNPNTMQKALAELERMGLVRTERTSGRFITDDENKIKELKELLAQEEIEKFKTKMKDLGFEIEDIIQRLKK